MANNYVYPTDPINSFDLSGQIAFYRYGGWNVKNAQISLRASRSLCGGWQTLLCLPAGGGGVAVKVAVKVIPKATWVMRVAKLGTKLMDSKLAGTTSKLFGNPSIANNAGQRAVQSGKLNQVKSNVRIGWSVTKHPEPRPVFRISIGHGESTRHYDLFHGSF